MAEARRLIANRQLIHHRVPAPSSESGHRFILQNTSESSDNNELLSRANVTLQVQKQIKIYSVCILMSTELTDPSVLHPIDFSFKDGKSYSNTLGSLLILL